MQSANVALPSGATAKCGICFASDGNYLDFTLVAIQSIIDHASPDFHYDITILGTDCGDREARLKPFQRENVSIRILDMEEYIEKFDMRSFHVSGNIPMAAYFRFFIPEIFADYDKVLYLDGDVLACDDVKHLLAEDLGDSLVGIMLLSNKHCLDKGRLEYKKNQLGISPEQYFCSGIMFYNIKECQKFSLAKKCVAKLKELVDPPYHDQDVLNAVTWGRRKQLPLRWHLITGYLEPGVQDKIRSLPDVQEDIRQAEQAPGLIHYGGAKPWNEDTLVKAGLWWKTADSTPMGMALRLRLARLQKERLAEAVTLMGKPWLFLSYAAYKVAAQITAGARRKELKRKAKLLKYIIRHGV